MHKLLSQIPIENIHKLLPDSIEKSKVKGLEELTASSSLSETRKRFYKLSLDSSPDLHLSYGEGLSDAYEQSKDFNAVLPDLTCKPLFLVKNGTYELFAQEFFQGIPIDESFEKGNLSEADVTNILRRIRSSFSHLEKESTTELILKEYEQFKKRILNNSYFNKLDLQFLKLFVFPHLKNELASVKPSLRLSPGDLAARNILVNDNKELRIIDLEFSYETHFHQEDWHRLTIFSSIIFQQIPFVQELIEKNSPSIEIYSYLRQTFLNKFVHSKEGYERYTCEDLYRIINYIQKHSSETIGSSLLIRGITNTLEKSLNNISEERNLRLSKETELEVQTLLRTQKENELDSEKQIRTQRENELDSEKQIRIQKENELDSEKQIRIQKENELDSEKQIRIQKENELDSEKQIRIQKENELDSEKQIRISKESDLVIKKNKIYRMQNSFSWKLTQPLRFLRRMLVDPFILRNSSINSNTNSYQDWIKHFDTLDNDKLSLLKGVNDSLIKKPLFSIVMPVFNPPKLYFEEAIQSVIDQLYENWELCIADDMSTEMYVREIIEKYSTKYPQIKTHFNEHHGHISKTSNNALKLATGQFVVLMDHDDLLRPHSLLRLAQVHNCKPNAKIIYSDEDKIDDSCNRFQPYFKPDWNPDLILAQNYMCHLFCADRKLVESVDGFKKGFEGSQDWDLVLRLVEKVEEKQIYHIPEILYHWRIHSGSVADNIDNKSYAVKAAKKAVEEHLARSKIEAKVSVTQNQFLRVDRNLDHENSNLATIIIPTKDNHDILRTCINSIFERSNGSKYEVIIVDNQSTEDKALQYYSELDGMDNFTVINYDKEFNYSAINNLAAKKAKGDILIFLNDDTEILSDKWIEEVISQATRDKIGAVGAKLFYPNGTIQHAGIILGYCKVAGEMMKGLPGNHPGQMQRANLIHNVSAVTGACLIIEKSKFLKVGGFDDTYFKIAFNDVDLCLKLLESGYKNLYTPHVQLIHHESISRGPEDTPYKIKRFDAEINKMLSKWGHVMKNDPNYNLNLSLDWEEQFQLAFPPRVNSLSK